MDGVGLFSVIYQPVTMNEKKLPLVENQPGNFCVEVTFLGLLHDLLKGWTGDLKTFGGSTGRSRRLESPRRFPCF